MKIAHIAVVVCAVTATFALPHRSATADQVDDLLAGKPVILTENTPPAAASQKVEPASFSLERRVVVPQSEKTLSDESWPVSLDEPSHVGLDSPEKTANTRQQPAPQMALSVVPEPSAVALATLSLVYFLIFFRRRYSF